MRYKFDNSDGKKELRKLNIVTNNLSDMFEILTVYFRAKI